MIASLSHTLLEELNESSFCTFLVRFGKQPGQEIPQVLISGSDFPTADVGGRKTYGVGV